MKNTVLQPKNYSGSHTALTKIDFLYMLCLAGSVLLFIFLLTGNKRLYGSQVDWISQHSVLPEYFRQLFYETGRFLPGFAAHLGGGQNIFNFSYYGLLSPVILPSYLFPKLSMTSYIAAVSVFLLLCSGALCYCWLRKRGIQSPAAMVCAFLFQFSAALVYHSHKQIMFVNYMPFLILALMGADRYFARKKSGLLMTGIFLMTMTSYFYSVGGLLALTVYGIYLYLQVHSREGLLNFLKAGLGYALRLIIPVGMSALLILPSLASILSGRTEQSVSPELSRLFFPGLDLLNLLYSPYGIGLTAISLLAMFRLTVRNRPGERVLFLLLSSLFSLPVFLYLLNGGLYLRGKVFLPFLPVLTLITALFLEEILAACREPAEIRIKRDNALSEPGDSARKRTGGSALRGTGASVLNRIGGSAFNRIGGSTLSVTGASALKRTGSSALSVTGASALRRTGASALNRIGGSAFNRIGGSALKRTGGSALRRIGGSAFNRIGGSALKRIGGSALRRTGDSALNGTWASALSGAGIFCLLLLALDRSLVWAAFVAECMIIIKGAAFGIRRRSFFLSCLPSCLISLLICGAVNISDPLVTAPQAEEIHSEEKQSLLEEAAAKAGSSWRINDLSETKASWNKTQPGMLRTSVYSSTYDAQYNTFHTKTMWNANGISNSITCADSNNILFQTFMGVKYLIGGETIPAGYHPAGQNGPYRLYENDAVFPLGWGSSKLMGTDEFASLSEADRSIALLNYIIVDNAPKTGYVSPLREERLDLPFPTVPDGTQYTVRAEDAVALALQAQQPLNERLLLLSLSFSEVPEKDIVIGANGMENRLTGRNAVYPNGNMDFRYVISCNQPDRELTLDFPAGSYEFSAPRLHSLDYEALRRAAGAVEPYVSSGLHADKTVMSGTITMKKDGYFTVSIPYDKGFFALVDGIPRKIERVNTAFLGLPLSAGTHTIELIYEPPLLKLGVTVSQLSLLLFLSVILLEQLAYAASRLTGILGNLRRKPGIPVHVN